LSASLPFGSCPDTLGETLIRYILGLAQGSTCRVLLAFS
jgi:hypothetical protein